MRGAAALLLLAPAGLLAVGLVGVGASSPPPEVAAGREVYERCAACHSLERDRVGPRHCGLFGRHAGSVPGFAYSDAMRNSGIVWNRQTLDVFLADPLGTVPGTFMTYAGIQDPKERAQLLAFLEVATRSEQCEPVSTGSRS
ncbi:MAG: c-type cytochrome [Candidatus Rokuibacteriota bacterium]